MGFPEIFISVNQRSFWFKCLWLVRGGYRGHAEGVLSSAFTMEVSILEWETSKSFSTFIAIHLGHISLAYCRDFQIKPNKQAVTLKVRGELGQLPKTPDHPCCLTSNFLFLVANKWLYVRVRQSVRPAIYPSICPSVCLSVCPSVRLSVHPIVMSCEAWRRKRRRWGEEEVEDEVRRRRWRRWGGRG